jgi:hypothetical protein
MKEASPSKIAAPVGRSFEMQIGSRGKKVRVEKQGGIAEYRIDLDRSLTERL